MTEDYGSVEALPTAADRLNEALVAFTGCVGEALDGICSYSLTIGEAYVPFNPDPEDECGVEDDEAPCEQAWVRVTSVTPGNVSEGFDGGDCTVELEVGLEVGVLRCLDIEEGGEAPTASAVLGAAMQSMEDMNAIFCAAMGCEVWDSINVGQWSPDGPLGGQYGGIWTFTASL